MLFVDGGGGGVFGAIAGRIWVNQSCVEFQKPDVKASLIQQSLICR